MQDAALFQDFFLGILGIVVLVTGSLAGNSLVIAAGAALICGALAIHAICILRHVRNGARAPDLKAAEGCGSFPGSDVLYSDRLVTLNPGSITFHNYYLPFISSCRTVLFQDIDRIEVRRPTVLNGRWRIGGSGDLRTWFPFDWGRPSRDRIFRAFIRVRGMNVGFTVEDPAAVTAILKKNGIPVSEEIAG